jgi:AcrR family transcriptional regulator
LARQERAERTRSNILDAAAKVFDERGFTGASLSDILARADVTKGALYFHFSSKDELAKVLIAEQFAVGDQPSTGVGLQSVIDMSHEMGHALQNDVRVRASMRLVVEANFSDPTPDSYLQWIKMLREPLQKAFERGDLRRELDVDDVANWVSAVFLGVWTQSSVLTNLEDIHGRLTMLWSIAIPGLVPPRRLSRFVPAGTVSFDSAIA